jgi:hypothetical protein
MTGEAEWPRSRHWSKFVAKRLAERFYYPTPESAGRLSATQINFSRAAATVPTTFTVTST